jgi:hypothetical protein
MRASKREEKIAIFAARRAKKLNSEDNFQCERSQFLIFFRFPGSAGAKKLPINDYSVTIQAQKRARKGANGVQRGLRDPSVSLVAKPLFTRAFGGLTRFAHNSSSNLDFVSRNELDTQKLALESWRKQ